MRPFALDPLFRALTSLAGVGPKMGKNFERLVGGQKVLDLLWHLPIDFIDRRFCPKIAEAPNGKVCTLTVNVEKHYPNSNKSSPYRVVVNDESGFMDLVFFRARKDYLQGLLPEKTAVAISGVVVDFRGKKQMTHPDFIVPAKKINEIQTVEPIYPLTQGLTNKVTAKAIRSAVGFAPDMPEWLDDGYMKRHGWPSWKEAVQTVHDPAGGNGLEPAHPARERLAYDEFLANQLALAIVRLRQRSLNGRSFPGDGHLRDALLEELPFELTGAQKNSLQVIYDDMDEPLRMLRLLQGDVGSGKTIVACMAMLKAVESGVQAAIMAPTEILARQHAESLKPFLDKIGVRFVVLTGRNKGKDRGVLKQQIENGAAQVVIGTHALFSEDIIFKDLGLTVIDEQHRFGVHQRLSLSEKGKGCDVLVMTATPIPRTLTLTAYGDMEVSRLDEKPAGRKPIETLLLPQEKVESLSVRLAEKIKDGNRVYWVCPLVEESEKIDLAAAQERYEILQGRFGDRVGLIHGRMKPAEKDAVMAKFSAGDLDLLVATTVIEVGVNVPEATIMVIEHAERFGLAQLHQLRGRVGRGSLQSYCFLVYSVPLTEAGKERLSVMRDTEDGFLIAEKDLELRGGGDILGTRQSGLPEFRLGDMSCHGELLAAARDDSKLILQRDPELKSERGEALRHLLYLFEKDQSIAYVRSG